MKLEQMQGGQDKANVVIFFKPRSYLYRCILDKLPATDPKVVSAFGRDKYPVTSEKHEAPLPNKLFLDKLCMKINTSLN